MSQPDDEKESSNSIKCNSKSFLRLVRSKPAAETESAKESVDDSVTEERSAPIISKIFYMPSVVHSEEKFTKKPAEEGFDIKAALMSSCSTKDFKSMNHSVLLREYRKKNRTTQATMLRYIRSSKQSPKMNGVSEAGHSSDSVNSVPVDLDTSINAAKVDENAPPFSSSPFQKSKESEITAENGNGDDNAKESDSGNEEDSPIVSSKFKARKRCITDSDEDSGPEPKRHQAEHINKKKLSPEMIENLIDAYCDLYTDVDKMEMYDLIREVNYDFVSLTKRLDSMKKKVVIIDKRAARMAELVEERKAREELKIKVKEQRIVDREEQKRKRITERLQKKKVWQMKAKCSMDFEDDDEEDFVKAVRVYDSDSSDDEEESSGNVDPIKLSSRDLVINFYRNATMTELLAVAGCSKKKAEAVIQCRPFDDWDDMVTKFKTEKGVSTDLLNNAVDLLVMRDTISKLMRKCENIASDIRSAVSNIMNDEESTDSCKITQPSIINKDLSLKPYQVIGLNWLALMYQQGLNGVLADEMGLGKTIQAIAFLAYLRERNELEDLSLIVVPSSTLDNWAKELELWCPSLGVLLYHGSQEERRGMRAAVANNELDENIYVMLTTYTMVTSTAEDRGLFKKIPFHTVIFDEAHMLKNMATQRFENLMKIRAKNRLLLTGTPLQNNLVELMSILVFVMPQLFEGKKDMLKKIFTMFPKTESKSSRGQYERKRIEQAKMIMAPFFLRRLKDEVLKDLPPKAEHLSEITMSDSQKKIYTETIQLVNARAEQIKKEILNSKEEEIKGLTDETDTRPKNCITKDSSANILMTLRKISNHPLLVRNLYTDKKLETIARQLHLTTHRDSILEYVIEDLSIMSDFEIHKTCLMYRSVSDHMLPEDVILNSGKFNMLDEMLPNMRQNGDRVLIFSQFVIMLDIIEDYMKIKGYSYHRLDGRTQVTERQEMIDDFNENDEVFAFLLSTRAGGLGINLSAANTVIIHDIDFNPYNDKQAEDRCHRVGQLRNVSVYRFITEGTIEQGMHTIATSKLQLEKDVTEAQESRKADVLQLLESALAVH